MAILENEIIFGIVLYKEKLENSVTFKTLVESIVKYNRDNTIVQIMVYDNTPNEGSNSLFKEQYQYNDEVEVLYYTENQNKGLPYAYNLFGIEAQKLNKKWVVFLDQDTELPMDFFERYLQANNDILIYCPLVFNSTGLMSPAFYKKFRSSQMDVPKSKSIALKDTSCINSGLMVNVDFFNKIGGYNTKLFLDFCDHDFLIKVKNNNIQQLGIIQTSLTQEFSAHTNTKPQAIFRYKLFVKDLKAFYVNKNKIQIVFMVDLPRLLKLTYQYKSLQFLKIRLT